MIKLCSKEEKEMKFNIKNYPGKYAMHCKSQREAEEFRNCLLEQGAFLWNDCSIDTRWSVHGIETVYFFNKGTYGTIYCASKYDYEILEWSQFDQGTPFTRSQLMDGDVVKFACGTTAIYIKRLKCFTTGYGSISEDDYTDKFIHRGNKNLDIVAVRRPGNYNECRLDIFVEGIECGELIYEAKEEKVEVMTLKQVCMALGKKVKIV